VLEKLAEDYALPRAIAGAPLPGSKLKNTYTDKLPQLALTKVTGRVHTHYAQAVAVTGAPVEQRPQPAEHPGEAPPKAGACAKLLSLHPAVSLPVRITRRSSCASWRTSAATRPCCVPSPTVMDVHRATAAEVFGVALDQVR
jgi:DNA polymerase-1